ncbi:MAG: biopolymer transporter ExbD [Verrucomicrobiota bacterium]
MRFRNYIQSSPAAMQLAPMIDIVFLLLIFFIVTWSYARFETELDVSVPAAAEGEDPKRSIGEIIVNVREDGTIVVEGRVETEESLFNRLSAIVERFKDQAVILRGDKRVPYDHIVRTLNVCKEAGIWNIAFATTRPEQAEAP